MKLLVSSVGMMEDSLSEQFAIHAVSAFCETHAAENSFSFGKGFTLADESWFSIDHVEIDRPVGSATSDLTADFLNGIITLSAIEGATLAATVRITKIKPFATVTSTKGRRE